MSSQQKTIDYQTLRHFWDVSKQFKKKFYLSFLIPFVSIFLYTIAPFMVGKILAGLLDPKSDITPFVVGFVFAAIGGNLANRIGFRNLLSMQPRVMTKLQQESLAMLLHRGTSFHNNQISGKLVSDAVEYSNSYNMLSNAFFINILPFVFTIVSGLAVITFSSPQLGLLMTVMSSVVIVSGIVQRKQNAGLRHIRIAANKAVTSHLGDAIVNNQAVKTFAREDFELIKHQELGSKLEKIRINNWSLIAKQGSDRIAWLLIFQLFFILLTIYLVRRNPALIATGIFAFSFTVTLTNRLFEIGNMLRIFEDSLQQAEPTTRALLADKEVADAPGAIDLKKGPGAISFDAIGFHYDDSSKEDMVFNNLTLNVKPGEKIGLVGPSGGGKSTITKLLLRFEDVQEGAIKIDNQDIKLVTQQSLRQAIAYVPQESLLFHRTIEENIKYGKTDATEAEVIAAAKNAHAHDFILALPKGYKTVVGERGVKLSGGQRQRVAIARAILKDATVLLLDEATSALDSESESAIQDALWKLMQGRTALVIAHRLSTIQRMDRIVVLDKGKIVEEGSHADLLKQNKLYARLWAKQSGGFLEQ